MKLAETQPRASRALDVRGCCRFRCKWQARVNPKLHIRPNEDAYRLAGWQACAAGDTAIGNVRKQRIATGALGVSAPKAAEWTALKENGRADVFRHNGLSRFDQVLQRQRYHLVSCTIRQGCFLNALRKPLCSGLPWAYAGEHSTPCLQLVSKPLSAATGCKARGSAFSAKRVLNVLQHASEPFSPRALTTSFLLDLATKQVLKPVVVRNSHKMFALGQRMGVDILCRRCS